MSFDLLTESTTARAAALIVPILFACAALPAQAADAEVAALLDKADAVARKASAPRTLVVSGSYTVMFEGQQQPVAKGESREIHRGSDVRQTSGMGEYGKMERGAAGDLVWELDPMMGAKVYAAPQAAAARRSFAIFRGAGPRALYAKFAAAGADADKTIDGVPCTAVRMTTADGATDTWYIDRATGRTLRIDTRLPAPESADVTFGISDFIDTELGFGDWREAAGVARPYRRTLKMGPATVTTTISKIEADVELPSDAFEAPPAVREAKAKKAAAGGADGQNGYQIVERTAQPVACIRLACKPGEISKALAIALPEVMAHINAVGGKMAGAPYSRYHAITADSIDLEAGIPISKPIEERGRVKSGELPGGRTVTGWHIGPYEQLKAAHEALAAFVAASKATARGGPYEVYWTDPGMVPDPAKWRTQLFQPIE